MLQYDTEEIVVVQKALRRYRRSKWRRLVKFFRCLFGRRKTVYKYYVVPPPVRPITLPSAAIQMHEEMERRRQTRQLIRRLPHTEAIPLSKIVRR